MSAAFGKFGAETTASASPLLSVVIPAKDAQDYIGDALECLHYQGVESDRIEPVVVDDGSHDDTARLATGILSDFPAAQLLRNAEPAGVSRARNIGLQAATAPYIALLDADDWFAAGHLGRMLKAIQTLHVDFVRTDIVRARRKTRHLWNAPVAVRNRVLRSHDFILSNGWQRTMVDFPNTLAGLYDRTLVDSGLLLFHEGLRTAEDREWNWRLFLADLKFAVIDSRGPVYRQSVESSLTATYNESQLDIVDSCQETIRLCHARPELEKFAVKAGHNLLALVDIHIQRADVPRALRKLLIQRTAAALGELTAAELDTIVGSFAPSRRKRLHGVLATTGGGQ